MRKGELRDPRRVLSSKVEGQMGAGRESTASLSERSVSREE